MPRRPSLVTHPMSDAMVEAVASRFRALAEPVRLRLMEALCRGPAIVGDLAAAARQSHANASKHLSVLAAAGLVVRRAVGNRAVYALADDSAERLCSLVCERVAAHAQGSLRSMLGRRRA